ncbi:hypothetical protein QFC19_001129 [Naganishia cerealis]|uniref:Uncharacterized protein n=1 Tax=Naganishia cerealis TaxID=610337 RepID=A0ACC2WJU0_9TREE|nr:hypothetical protein QFC19_001129 [Naganishia cerealis]
MARRRQAFNRDLSSYAEPATNQNPANRSAPNAAPAAQQQQQQQQQHRHHHHHPAPRAPGPVHARVTHEVDTKTVDVPGEPTAQVIAPAAEDDSGADEDDEQEQDDTDDDANSKLPPGTLDMSAYEFSDAKLGIVFENAEMAITRPASETEE